MTRHPNLLGRTRSPQQGLSLLWGSALLLVLLVACFPEPDVRPDLVRVVVGPTGDGRDCTQADLAFRPDELVVTFIDVGQGDAIWIRTPNDGVPNNGVREGHNILIDAGDLGVLGRTDGGAIVTSFLLRNGLQPGDEIHTFLVTHPHSDHFGGYGAIFDTFAVRNVVDPGFEQGAPQSYFDFLARAEEETTRHGGSVFRPAIPRWVPQRYARTTAWGTELDVQVLNSRATPNPEYASDQANNASIVLRIGYAGRAFLLMGDAHWEIELEIERDLGNLGVNLLKVGHHGSKTSSATTFLESSFSGVPFRERYAVIPAGRRTFSGVQHPNLETVLRIHDFVPFDHLYSTEHDDAHKEELEAPDDDHILFVIDGRGRMRACYWRQ